jgi:hypothetical protein
MDSLQAQEVLCAMNRPATSVETVKSRVGCIHVNTAHIGIANDTGIFSVFPRCVGMCCKVPAPHMVAITTVSLDFIPVLCARP